VVCFSPFRIEYFKDFTASIEYFKDFTASYQLYKHMGIAKMWIRFQRKHPERDKR
jgi:hypothetical protein